jgi:hypothetical protein
MSVTECTTRWRPSRFMFCLQRMERGSQGQLQHRSLEPETFTFPRVATSDRTLQRRTCSGPLSRVGRFTLSEG